MSSYPVPPTLVSSALISPCPCAACRHGRGADQPVRAARYTSDMSDAEWAVVAPLLPLPCWLDGHGGRPEKYCRRAVIDAIRYVCDNGVKWRNLPSDFPPWRTVHAAFTRWWQDGDLHELHESLREKIRVLVGKNWEPSAAIIDSQSIRAAETVGKDTSGYDGGKRVGGRKRHIAVDTLGLLLVCVVTAASVQDRDGAKPLLERLRAIHEQILLVWADGAYAGKLVGWATEKLKLALDIVKRTDDMTGFVVLRRRWVVERTLSWICRRRRCVRDYERLPEHHEAMVKWAMVIVMSRRLARQPRQARTP